MNGKSREYTLECRNKWHVKGFVGASLAVFAIFFIAPMFEKNFLTHLLLQCSFTMLILSAMYAIDGKQSILAVGMGLLIPLIYFDSLSFQHHSKPYMMIACGLSSLFTLFAIVVIMNKILAATRVNATLIFGALMVYLLAGILWGSFYFVDNLVSPGSFHGAGGLNFESVPFLALYEQQFNFLYYSFATLATLGMGDITPLSHLAKSLTAMEAMFGQLFIAVIIAKLVSAWWRGP